MNRYKDWFEQAKRDLDHARKSLEMEDYEWLALLPIKEQKRQWSLYL